MKSIFTGCAFWAMAMLAPTIVLSPAKVEAKNATLSVLTNNVYFLTEILNWGQRTRARMIAASDYIKDHDVVVFEECFASAPCRILRDGLKNQYPYQTPTLGHKTSEWDSTSGSFSFFKFENGGVVVMSKWPIKQKHQYVYSRGCGTDGFVNKGFVYVVLDYEGMDLHVFATHMQSDDINCSPGKAALNRSQALNALRKFIDARKIPSTDLVVVVGDFNIDKGAPEFLESLVAKLQVHPPDVYEGHKFTWDPVENSIAHCNYLQSKDGEYIDYVFVDKEHSNGVKTVVQTALKVYSPNYVLGREVFDDFSDHFPVKAVIELEWPESETEPQAVKPAGTEVTPKQSPAFTTAAEVATTAAS